MNATDAFHMQTLKDALAAALTPSFKDARMTLEAVLSNSSLDKGHLVASAYAVSTSLGAKSLAEVFATGLTAEERELAEVAVSTMGMTNVYYSFLELANIPSLRELPAQLRMVTYGQQSAKNKLGFEVAALAVSIAGKCRACVVSHVEALRELGFRDEQFRDLARLVASLNAIAKAL